MHLRLMYWREDVDPEHGKCSGCIISIGDGWELGTKERGPEMARTRIRADPELLAKLYSGEITVDVEKTTEQGAVFSRRLARKRQVAMQFVGLPVDVWRKSDYFQPVADSQFYEAYVSAFLQEFTARTTHIPFREQVTLFPPPLVFPCRVDVLVGRDGIAFAYQGAHRPEDASATIDQSVILDALLVPHPRGKDYSFPGPTVIDTSICNDTHYRFIRGNGMTITSAWGNPYKVILERRSHMFLQDVTLRRIYPDGQVASRAFQFVEIFGSTDPANFSIEKARHRAQLYASRWAVNAITGGQLGSLGGIREAVQELRDLVDSPGTLEPTLEVFFDENTWMLERVLSYAKYQSQVMIPEEVLSRSEHNIRPDKLLERHDGYSDVFDLKKADVTLVVGKDNRHRQPAELSDAEAQVETYVRFLEEPAVREYLRGVDIRVLRPRGILLIGRRPEDTDAWEDVRKRLQVIAHTYDDVLEELNVLVGWIGGIVERS